MTRYFLNADEARMALIDADVEGCETFRKSFIYSRIRVYTVKPLHPRSRFLMTNVLRKRTKT